MVSVHSEHHPYAGSKCLKGWYECIADDLPLDSVVPSYVYGLVCFTPRHTQMSFIRQLAKY